MWKNKNIITKDPDNNDTATTNFIDKSQGHNVGPTMASTGNSASATIRVPLKNIKGEIKMKSKFTVDDTAVAPSVEEEHSFKEIISNIRHQRLRTLKYENYKDLYKAGKSAVVLVTNFGYSNYYGDIKDLFNNNKELFDRYKKLCDTYGCRCFRLKSYKTFDLIIMPVNAYNKKNNKSYTSKALVRKSLQELLNMSDKFNYKDVIINCNGFASGFDSSICDIFNDMLDDRFTLAFKRSSYLKAMNISDKLSDLSKKFSENLEDNEINESFFDNLNINKVDATEDEINEYEKQKSINVEELEDADDLFG